MNSGIQKNRVIVAAGCAAALSLWGAKAAAQSGIGPDLVGRLGAARPERQISLQLIENAQYDSDIARGSSELATVRGVRKDDILYAPAAKLTLSLPAGRQYLFLEGSAGYDFYQYNKLLQRERIDMMAGLTTGFGPCQASLQGAYSRSQSDLADLVAAVTKNTIQQTSIGVQGACSTGAGLGETLGYQHSHSGNSAKIGVVDADVDAVSGGLNYGSRALGQVGLTASYSKVTYGNTTSLALNLPTPTGFETVGGQLTFQRPIGNRLQGSASIGYSRAKSTGTSTLAAGPATTGSNGEFTGITGTGSLSYNVTSRLQMSLTYQRSVTPTIQDGSNFAIQQRIGLDGHYKFTSRLDGGLGANWSERSFRDQPVPTPNLIVTDRLQSIYGSIRMTVGRNASFAIDAHRDVRNTNLTLFNYTDYRIGVTAIQSF